MIVQLHNQGKTGLSFTVQKGKAAWSCGILFVAIVFNPAEIKDNQGSTIYSKLTMLLECILHLSYNSSSPYWIHMLGESVIIAIYMYQGKYIHLAYVLTGIRL